MSKDNLGDRMKSYERHRKTKTMSGLPVVIRLDGKGFSKFTTRFKRPFDMVLRQIMNAITIALVKETNAVVGYNQSDEITLVLYNDNPKGQLHFDGEIDKLNSTLAAKAASVFTKMMCRSFPEFMDEDYDIVFDCRTFDVPNIDEAVNAVYWRYQDCLKNSVTQVAQEHFSHSELMNKNGNERIAMIEQSGNKPWCEYHHWFKEGVFVKKEYYIKDETTRTRIVPNSEQVDFNKMTHSERKAYIFGD